MEISFVGSSEELASLVLTLGRPSRSFGDILPPPPPVSPPCPACDLTAEEVARLRSSLAALAAAGSGSFLSTDQGAIVAVPHGVQMCAPVWNPSAAAWQMDFWPPT